MKTINIQLRAWSEKAADGSLRIVASDETMDRSGESIPFESWDLSNFEKSPRLLIDHDYRVQAIVGKAMKVEKDTTRKAITFEPNFHDITQAAKETKAMVDQGFLDTVSVGFLRKTDEKGIESNELMEISFVAVPANPSARTLSVKALEPETEKTINDWVMKELGKVEAAILDKSIIEGKAEPAEGDACTMEDGSDGVMTMQEDGTLACMMKKAPEPKEGDLCTMEDGSEGIMGMDDSGAMVCMIKPTEEKEELEKEPEEKDVKAGKVLSAKNRSIITAARDTMQSGIAALEELLAATEEAKGGADEAQAKPELKKGRKSPSRIEPKTQRELELISVMRAVNTAFSEALHKAKR